MAQRFLVCAGWLEPEEAIGSCLIENARGRETISFSYNTDWLSDHPGFILDPNLYPMEGRQFPPEGIPCFGFLSDIAPDRWGRTLMDRREGIAAKEEARPRKNLMESDYILGVNDKGRIGGIRLKNEEGGYLSEDELLAAPPMEKLRDLEEASRMLESDKKNEERWLRTLLQPGSSLGGARPKSNVIDENGDFWIAKFPSKNDDIDVGAWEMVAHELAKRCGLTVPDARAIRFSDAGTTFLSKRFDRKKTRRVHYSSAMTMTGIGDMEPASYLDLVEVVERLSPCAKIDLAELWDRMIFNICISNTDDHLRNHGFLLSDDGWRLSPVFDVNPSLEKDEMSLAIGKTCAKDFSEVFGVCDFFRLDENEALERIKHIQGTIRECWQKEALLARISRSEQEYMKEAFSQAYTELPG